MSDISVFSAAQKDFEYFRTNLLESAIEFVNGKASRGELKMAVECYQVALRKFEDAKREALLVQRTIIGCY